MHEIVWGKNDVDIQNAISYRGLNVKLSPGFSYY